MSARVEDGVGSAAFAALRRGESAEGLRAAEDEGSESSAVEARALRALEISGRTLAKRRDGQWCVLNGRDRRGRPIVSLPMESVERLAREGVLRAVDETAYVLASSGGHKPVAEPAPRWVFIAAAARRPGKRTGGVGFAGLAMLARQGRGPLNMRQVLAGLRLVRDAERAAGDARLTMNWDAGPVTRQRRGGAAGGVRGDANLAGRFLERLRAKIGDPTWRLVWGLCVDADSLLALKKRFAISQADVHGEVARALDALADAYDGRG